MSRSDYTALIFSFLALVAGFIVHDRIFERMAHIEDEMAYVWQAQAIAGGRLTLPSPPEPKSFLLPFVVDYNGQRFSKYPLGWPVLLSFGERLKIRFLVNPLLGALGVWLTYLLGKRIFSETVGLLAAGLTLTSPFFLMNTGSLLSHPLGLVLSAAFCLAWIDGFCRPGKPPDWLPTLVTGSTLGLLAMTRPLTAVGVALPFIMHAIFLLVKADKTTRLRLIISGVIALSLSGLVILWQYAVTGDPLHNPYTLWWEYDKIGFGPGVGRISGGHTLHQARINTRFSLQVGRYDLFGWGSFSWIFLPLGFIAMLRDKNWRALLPLSVFPSLVFVYLAYWIGSSLFGPRYFYEGLYSLTLLSGAGISLLAGWPTQGKQQFPINEGWGRVRPLLVTALLAMLVSVNLIFYTPLRLGSLFGLYGVQRSHLQTFTSSGAQEFSPALIIVHTSEKWIEYGTFLELQNPFLDSPFIFVISRGTSVDKYVASQFPERSVFHYYPANEPFILYTGPVAGTP